MASEPSPRAVIFDLGDTLLRQTAPSNPLAGTERLLELAKPGCALTAKEIQALASAMNAETARRTDDPELLLEFPCQAFQRTLNETLGVSYTVDYPQLEQEFWSAALRFEPADGIFDVLDTLRDRNIRTCVLSLPHEQRGGFKDRLEAIMESSSDIGWGYHDTLSDDYYRAFPEDE